VCSVKAAFNRKRDLIKYIEDSQLDITQTAVIHGNQKTITRERIPVVDVS